MLKDFFLKNKNTIKRLSVFVISFILIFLSFQKESKFAYEFQEDTPWQHEDLFAPFGFPIHKLPDELKHEQDSVLKNPKLRFILNQNVKEEQITNLQNDFERYWKNFVMEDSIKRITDRSYRYKKKPSKKIYYNFLKKLINAISFVYEKGIYDPSDILSYTENNDYKLVFQKDDFVKTYTREQVFTLKGAYEYVSDKFKENLKNSTEQSIATFFQQFKLEKYIDKNLFFDKEKTEEYKISILNDISETRGYIQAGELIISRGEIISKDKYRILLSLKKYYQQNQGIKSRIFILIGDAIIMLLLLLMLTIYIKNNKKEIYNNFAGFMLIYILIVFFVGGANLINRFGLFNIYVFPVILLPIIVKTFFGERLALYVLLTTILFIAFGVANSFEFVLIQFVGGFAAIFGITQLERRGQIYMSSLNAFIAMSLIYTALSIVQTGDFAKIDTLKYLFFAIEAVLLLLAYPLIYMFERLFGFISDVTLLELSNSNTPLLQKLATTAPGTFQHSLQVANIAESAAKKIGANSLLVKAGALYHDIGKITTPAFFIENQVTGYNPHDQLEFDQSAKIIISHVTQGIALAHKYKLPQQVIDFIQTHHGTTTVQYFYKNYIKKYPEKKTKSTNFHILDHVLKQKNRSF
jgi:putative nucleotidyltransferase with HDIG domain